MTGILMPFCSSIDNRQENNVLESLNLTRGGAFTPHYVASLASYGPLSTPTSTTHYSQIYAKSVCISTLPYSKAFTLMRASPRVGKLENVLGRPMRPILMMCDFTQN